MELAVIIIAAWIMSTCFHEFGHAVTAYWGGDHTVKDRGYLTLNPFVYINSATTLVIPVIFLMLGGIALPGAAVVINTGRIKSRFMQSLVSFAGPLFTLIFMIFLVVLMHTLPALKGSLNEQVYTTLSTALSFLIYIHVFVFILNLLPLPPLDGWGILEPWMPLSVKNKARQLSNIGFLILLGLFFFVPIFGDAIGFVSALVAMLVGANLDLVQSGFTTLKANSYQMLAVLVIAWIARGKMATPEEKAQKLLKDHKYDEALKLFDEQLAKKPDHPQALISSATCLLSLGRQDEAISRVKKSIAIDDQNPQAYGILAACLSDARQPAEAIAASEKAIKYDTNQIYPFVYFVKANALNQLGRFEEALEAIENFLKTEKAPGESLLVKANALEGLGKFDEALAVYDKAERSTLANSLHLQLAKGILLCCVSRDRTKEAISLFDKFLPKEPDDRAREIEKIKVLLNEKADHLEDLGHPEMASCARLSIADLQNAI